MELFKRVLLDPSTPAHEIEINSLRLNKDKKMSRIASMKTALSDVFLKMRVLEDKIRTEPLKLNDKFV